MADPSFVVFLNGVYGTGKSTVLDHVGDLLAQRGRAFALFDIDWFHRSWPAGADDPHNVITEAENLADVWANYRRQASRLPVVAGVLASRADTERYQDAFALPLRPVLLTASSAVLERRLRRRYASGRAVALQWHLDRLDADTERIRAGGQFERVIDTDRLSPTEVAADIIDHIDHSG